MEIPGNLSLAYQEWRLLTIAGRTVLIAELLPLMTLETRRRLSASMWATEIPGNFPLAQQEKGLWKGARTAVLNAAH